MSALPFCEPPVGGASFEEALHLYCDRDLLDRFGKLTVARPHLRKSRSAAPRRNWVTDWDTETPLPQIGVSRSRRRRATARNTELGKIQKALHGEIRERLLDGTLTAFGARNYPDEIRRIIAPDTWAYLRTPARDPSTAIGPDRLVYYSVRIYDTHRVRDWNQGLSLAAVAKELCPDHWPVYRRTNTKLTVLGSPKSESNRSTNLRARCVIETAILESARNGDIEVAILTPMGVPDAVWKNVSSDNLAVMSERDLDLDRSTIRLPGQTPILVRVFPARHGDSRADCQNPASPAPQTQNLKSRVYAYLDSLPKAQLCAIAKTRQKAPFYDDLCKALPDASRASIERYTREWLSLSK